MRPKKKIAKRAQSVELAPLTSLKIKRRPRGRPFEPGNGFGAATRWKKGQSSPNPSGRPACKEINRAARAQLAEAVPGHPTGKTFAEALVDVLMEQGLDGSIGATSLLADRAEGRPAVAVGINNDHDPLTELVKGMREMSKRLGKPEGHVPIQPNDEGVEEALQRLGLPVDTARTSATDFSWSLSIVEKSYLKQRWSVRAERLAAAVHGVTQ